MKYKLIPHNVYPDSEALTADGKVLACPFQNPVGMKAPLSDQTKIVPVACGTWCALFEQHNNVTRLNCTPNRYQLVEAPGKATDTL